MGNCTPIMPINGVLFKMFLFNDDVPIYFVQRNEEAQSLIENALVRYMRSQNVLGNQLLYSLSKE